LNLQNSFSDFGDRQIFQLKIYQNTKVLIIAGGDIIRSKHSLEMYENIPKAQLCIMPGETHCTSVKPKLFNKIE
jgi:hypothetical protein